MRLYGAGYLLPFFIEIKAFPDTDGGKNGVLGMELAEDFEVVGGLATVDGRLRIVSLDLPIFFIAHF
jgi:hypothetical protein